MDELTPEAPGRYSLLREHGRSARAIIHVARDAHTGREVAFKVLREGQDPEPFLREVRLTGRLEHQGIAPIYELGRRRSGEIYATQKLVLGKTLREAIDAATEPGARLALLPRFAALCGAVGLAHARKVVHRDLRPELIVLGQFGEAVVLDWSLARSLDEPLLPEQTGGASRYASPEPLAQRDQRSDVYSLGVMLGELLAQSRTQELGELPELAAVAARALQKRPGRRYPSARELASDLRAWLSGERVSAYSYSSAELLRRFLRRNRALSAAFLAALLVAALAGSLLYRSRERARAALAQTLIWKGEAAELQQRWAHAAAFYAAAREQLDGPEARIGLSRSAPRAPAALPAHLEPGPLTAAALLPDGSVALAGVGQLALVQGEKTLFRLETGPLQAVAAAPALFATLRADGVVALRSLEGRQLRTLPVLAHALALSSDGRRVATASADAVELWDALSGERLARLTERASLVALAGDSLVTAGAKVHLRSGRAETELPSDGPVSALALSRDGTLLALRDARGLHLHDLAAHSVLGQLDGATGAAVFSPDGALLAVPSGSEVVVYETRTQQPLLRLEVGPAALVLGFSGDGVLAVVTGERLLRFALADALEAQGRLLEGSGFCAVAFSPDGRTLATGCGGAGAVHLWDARTRQLRKTLSAQEGAVRGLAFSPDGKRLGAVAADGTLALWDTTTWALVFRLRAHAAVANDLTFSPAGSLLATAGYDRTVAIWDAATGRPLRRLSGHDGEVNALSFSPDGRTLASASADRTAILWDTANWAQRARVEANELSLEAAAFSPDGHTLAVAGGDGTVRLLDPLTLAELRRLRGHRNLVQAVAFSPDGKRLASGAMDGTLRLWDPRTGRLLATRRGRDEAALAFSPDGHTLAAAGTDPLIELLRMDGPLPSLAQLLAAHRLLLRGADLLDDREAR